MKQTYFTQQNHDQARSLFISFLGAVVLIGTGVVLLLVFFDVLVE